MKSLREHAVVYNSLQAWIMHPGNNSQSVSLKGSGTFSRPPELLMGTELNTECTRGFQEACGFLIIRAVQSCACCTTHVVRPEQIHKNHNDWFSVHCLIFVIVNIIYRNESKK